MQPVLRRSLKNEKIEVGDNDLVEPPVDTTINSSGFHINVFRARPVIIVDQNQQHRVVTPYQSAELILPKTRGLLSTTKIRPSLLDLKTSQTTTLSD